jgi:hypothetical protein
MPLIEHMWRMSAVSISTRYVLIASMDVTPEAESLFNEVYDTEHVPNLLQVPGVHSVTRMKGEPARFAIAGAVRELPAPSPNTVHFTIWMAVAKSVRVIGCGARGRSG